MPETMRERRSAVTRGEVGVEDWRTGQIKSGVDQRGITSS